ncbi:11434_t:CDS:2, partial [Funneliformis geosporum]
ISNQHNETMDGNSEDPSMTLKHVQRIFITNDMPLILFKRKNQPSLRTQKKAIKRKIVSKLPIKESQIIMGNISPFTPSSAPWAKDDDHDTHKLLHLHEFKK